MKGNRSHWFEQKGHRYQCYAYLSMEMEGYRSSCEVNVIEFRMQLLIFIFLKGNETPLLFRMHKKEKCCWPMG